MNRYQKDFFYAFCIAVLLALNIFIFLYQEPNYQEDIVCSEFQLLTQDGKDLGWAFSTINLQYQPNRNIGRFLILINTEVGQPYWHHPIYSKEVHYRVSFWHKSRLIEQIDGAYLGAMNPNYSRKIYNAILLHMEPLEFRYGKIRLTIEGAFYNVTSNEVLTENTFELNLFIINPYIRIISFLLLIGFFLIAIFERS
jgi:hypothetical protein